MMDGVAVHEAIEELISRYLQTWRSHDMEAWGELFTEDADFVTHTGLWWTPNARNVAEHKDVPDYVIGQKGRYQLQVAGIHMVKDDVALLHARWRWPQFARTPSGVASDVQGIITMVLVCRAGRWLIRASHNTKELAPPDASARAR